MTTREVDYWHQECNAYCRPESGRHAEVAYSAHPNDLDPTGWRDHISKLYGVHVVAVAPAPEAAPMDVKENYGGISDLLGVKVVAPPRDDVEWLAYLIFWEK